MPIIALLLIVLMLPVTVPAQTLSIATPTYSQDNSSNGVLRPVRGMSMQQVTQQFGTPVSRDAAVGQPPISRWHYPQFDVYFEQDKVLHAVVRREHQTD